jgi:hypothetical protein
MMPLCLFFVSLLSSNNSSQKTLSTPRREDDACPLGLLCVRLALLLLVSKNHLNKKKAICGPKKNMQAYSNAAKGKKEKVRMGFVTEGKGG